MEALGFSLPLWLWCIITLIGIAGMATVVVPALLKASRGGAESALAPAPAPATSPSRSKDKGGATGFFVFLCVIAGLVVLYFLVVDQSEYHWTHDTLPVAETREALAECRMRADEAIQAGSSKDMARLDYTANCMIAAGFSKERIEEGGGE